MRDKPTDPSRSPHVLQFGQGIGADAYLAAIVDSSDDAIIGKTLEGIIASWNQAAARIFGYSADEAIGQPVTIIVPQDRAEEERSILTRIRRGEHVPHFETVRLRKGGGRIDVGVSVSPIKDAHGRILGASKIARDITELKRSKESATRLQIAIDGAPNGIVMITERGVITMVNAQMERLFGYHRSEMIGQPIEMLLPERYRASHPQQRQEFFRSPAVRAMGHGRDLYARRKDGSEFPVEVGLNPAETPEGTFVLAAVIDITQRKRMEEELARVHADIRDHARNLETAVRERTAKLEEAVSDLETFSYTVSHDLRSPLRTMQGFAHLVLTDYGEMLDEQARDYLRRIDRAAERFETPVDLCRTIIAYWSYGIRPRIE